MPDQGADRPSFVCPACGRERKPQCGGSGCDRQSSAVTAWLPSSHWTIVGFPPAAGRQRRRIPELHLPAKRHLVLLLTSTLPISSPSQAAGLARAGRLGLCAFKTPF